MNPRVKICFFLYSLDAGGAERVASHVIRHLNDQKFEKHLILFTRTGEYLKDIPASVTVHELGVTVKSQYSAPSLKLFSRLSNTLKAVQPDVVFSFSRAASIAAILVRQFTSGSYKIVIRESTNISRYLKTDHWAAIKKFFLKCLYPKADAIITPSKGVQNDLAQNLNVPADRIFHIFNPINIERIESCIQRPAEKRAGCIISAGRLIADKNYPMALRAIKAIESDVTSYEILGGGECRADLEQLAKQLNINHKVKFLGYTANPYQYIAAANIFLLSSVREGFPNVLIEAMACGTPVVATDCESGPNEIITNGINGLLVAVNDEKQTSEAILKILKNDDLKRRLVEAGQKRAQDFSIKKIIPQFEELILSVLKGH